MRKTIILFIIASTTMNNNNISSTMVINLIIGLKLKDTIAGEDNTGN